MSNVIDFKAEKNKRRQQLEDPLFQKQIDRMDRVQLLEEMVKYSDARAQAKDPGSTFWLVRGIILFTALEEKCETSDVKVLAGSFRRHLQKELELKKGPKSP